MASTGITEEEAKKKGIDVDIVYAVDNYRPEFMPTYEKVTLKVVFEKESRRIIGAQLNSKADLTQSINTISVCIQNNMTIDEQIEWIKNENWCNDYDTNKKTILIMDDREEIISSVLDDLAALDNTNNFFLEDYNILTVSSKMAGFSVLDIFILETKSLRAENLTNQYLYIQAKNHKNFLKEYLKNIDLNGIKIGRASCRERVSSPV